MAFLKLLMFLAFAAIIYGLFTDTINSLFAKPPVVAQVIGAVQGSITEQQYIKVLATTSTDERYFYYLVALLAPACPVAVQAECTADRVHLVLYDRYDPAHRYSYVKSYPSSTRFSYQFAPQSTPGTARLMVYDGTVNGRALDEFNLMQAAVRKAGF
jgi:hypothetical protein